MATGADWNCPICREASSNIAYVGNCLHQFCHSCILRWAKKNPSCPLCRQRVHTIIYPTGPNHDFVETAVPQPSEPPSAGPQDEPSAAEPQPQGRVEEFSPETWALCFRTHSEILRPVELWLEQVLCGACWWDVAFAQGRIMASLCRYGLHEEALARELEPVLREQTPTFVRRLIEVASEQCTELARRHIGTARPQAEPGDTALPGTSRAPEPRRGGSEQLREGAEQRRGGSEQRREGSEQLREGAEQRREGSEQLREGAEQRREGSEQRREGAEPAGPSEAAQSGRSGPSGAAGQSRRRRGGSRERGATHKKRWRRQS